METILRGANTKVISTFLTKSLQTNFLVRYTLERHVYNLIMDYLSIHHPLSDSQWGLQSGKSIVSLLLATTHNWLRILEENSEISAVFFDLCKVFDSVPHHKLRILVKLQQTGLCPHVLNSSENRGWRSMGKVQNPKLSYLVYLRDQCLAHFCS